MGSKKNTEIILTPAQADELAAFLPDRPDPLYPFAIPGAPLGDQARRELREQGILDNAGALSPDHHKILAILGKAGSMARFKMLVAGDLLEYQVFWGRNTGASASLSPHSGGFKLESPARSADLLEVLTDFSGVSMTGVVPALGELPIIEALCALATADLTRRELLLALSGDAPWKPVPVTVERLLQVLRREDLNSGWLVWSLTTLLRAAPALDAATVGAGLAALEKRGLLKRHGNGMRAAENLLVLSEKLITINNLYKIDALRLAENGRPIRQTFGVVQNACREILYLETTDTTVFLTGLSGKALGLLLEKYLTQAEAIPLVSPPPAASGGSAAGHPAGGETMPCESCGKLLDADARFCKFCGTPQGKAPEVGRFCSKCGTALKPGKKFCHACGHSG